MSNERKDCIDCPHQHEQECCHNTITGYDDRKEIDAIRHQNMMRRVNKQTRVYGTLVAQPWEND